MKTDTYRGRLSISHYIAYLLSVAHLKTNFLIWRWKLRTETTNSYPQRGYWGIKMLTLFTPHSCLLYYGFTIPLPSLAWLSKDPSILQWKLSTESLHPKILSMSCLKNPCLAGFNSPGLLYLTPYTILIKPSCRERPKEINFQFPILD